MATSLIANYRGVFDGAVGFGTRPVVLVVDFIAAYTTPEAPLYAPAVVRAVAETVDLLAAARASGVPVVYTRVVYSESAIEGGVFVRKVPVLRTLVAGAKLAEIVDEVAPAPGDLVLVKQFPSAFFGTPLATVLATLRADTIVLTGCSTSGCIRATAVDGMSYGYRVIVPRECVGDRHEAPHEANLFDIQSKYGDVVAKADALAFLRSTRCAH